MSKSTEPQPKKKECFVICPLSDDLSQVRRKSEGLIDVVLRPTLEKFDYTVTSPLEIHKPGSITNQIVDLLLNADLVIGVLTGLNPNVMYELAIRHSAAKNVIVLAEKGTVLPFDIQMERTIFYDDDIAGVNKLEEKIRAMVTNMTSSEDYDNPVYRSKKSKAIIGDLPSEDPMKYIVKLLENIQSDIINKSGNESKLLFEINTLGVIMEPKEGHNINGLKSLLKRLTEMNINSSGVTMKHLEDNQIYLQINFVGDSTLRLRIINVILVSGYRIVMFVEDK